MLRNVPVSSQWGQEIEDYSRTIFEIRIKFKGNWLGDTRISIEIELKYSIKFSNDRVDGIDDLEIVSDDWSVNEEIERIVIFFNIIIYVLE